MPLRAHRQYFMVKVSQRTQKQNANLKQNFSTAIKTNSTENVMLQSWTPPPPKFSDLTEQKFISHSKLAVGQGDPQESFSDTEWGSKLTEAPPAYSCIVWGTWSGSMKQRGVWRTTHQRLCVVQFCTHVIGQSKSMAMSLGIREI